MSDTLLVLFNGYIEQSQIMESLEAKCIELTSNLSDHRKEFSTLEAISIETAESHYNKIIERDNTLKMLDEEKLKMDEYTNRLNDLAKKFDGLTIVFPSKSDFSNDGSPSTPLTRQITFQSEKFEFDVIQSQT